MDDDESFLFEELGSLILNQIRLSESKQFCKSNLVDTAWCRTCTKWPWIGIAVCWGLDVKMRSSEMHARIWSQLPGSTENCEAGIEWRSRYKLCNQMRMSGHSWVTHRASPKNFSKVLREQWDEDCNLLSKSKSFWRLDSGNETKPDRIWKDQPIQTMHDPSSHFFHEMGKPVNKQSIAITAALSPIIVVSWIQRRSSTYKKAAWGRKHKRWNNRW